MINPVTGVSIGRIVIGAAALAKPDLVAGSMAQQSHSKLLTQWFGSREVALGTLTLLARGSSRRNLVLVGIVVDGADAATGLQALESGDLPPGVGRLLVGIAGGAALSGLLGIRQKKKPKKVKA